MVNKSLALLILGYVIQLAYSGNACSWTVWSDNQQMTLDLSKCSHREHHAEDPRGNHYDWTVCRDAETCKGESVMVAIRTAGDLCYIAGRWDPSINPQYESTNGGTWTFIYDNGDTDCGSPARTWMPKLVCSPGVHWKAGTVTEQTGSCLYEVEIKTKYACANTTNQRRKFF